MWKLRMFWAHFTSSDNFLNRCTIWTLLYWCIRWTDFLTRSMVCILESQSVIVLCHISWVMWQLLTHFYRDMAIFCHVSCDTWVVWTHASLWKLTRNVTDFMPFWDILRHCFAILMSFCWHLKVTSCQIHDHLWTLMVFLCHICCKKPIVWKFVNMKKWHWMSQILCHLINWFGILMSMFHQSRLLSFKLWPLGGSVPI